jgi:hypothetical protein
MSDEFVELELEFRRELMAALVFFDGDREYVLPKSQVEIVAEGNEGLWTIEIPEWLAVKEGLA